MIKRIVPSDILHCRLHSMEDLSKYILVAEKVFVQIMWKRCKKNEPSVCIWLVFWKHQQHQGSKKIRSIITLRTSCMFRDQLKISHLYVQYSFNCMISTPLNTYIISTPKFSCGENRNINLSRNISIICKRKILFTNRGDDRVKGCRQIREEKPILEQIICVC